MELNSASNIYVGSTPAKAVYLGSTLIWPAGPLVPWKWVDLGLPSGTLWADRNLGANIELDPGLYYRWGEVTGVAYENLPSSYLSYNTEGYTFCSDVDGNDELVLGKDAAYCAYPSAAQIPSDDQWRELTNSSYTTMTYENLLNVIGVRITSRSNGNSIFIPAYGYGGTKLDVLSRWMADGCYHSRINIEWPETQEFSFSLSGNSISNWQITDGASHNEFKTIRPVKYKPRYYDYSLLNYVDLGLPSGTLWAELNVGTWNPAGENSWYFRWGELGDLRFDNNNNFYNWTPYYNSNSTLPGQIPSSLDPVWVGSGGTWKTPIKEQWQELFQYTRPSTITSGGRKVIRLTSTINGNMIDLPCCSWINEYGQDAASSGDQGYYLSKTSVSGYPYSIWIEFGSSDSVSHYDGITDYAGLVWATIRPVKA